MQTEIINARDRNQIIKEMQRTSDKEGLGDIVYRIKKIKAPTEPLPSTRSPLLKILAVPVILGGILLAIILLTGKKSGDILIPDPHRLFYVYLHDVDDQTGDPAFPEKLNYLLFQSLNQFPEFKTINEDIASSLYNQPGATAGNSGILVKTVEKEKSIRSITQNQNIPVDLSQEKIDFLSKKFNLLFEVKVSCTRFNDFYNIDAVLIPVMRGKKSFHITVPIQNKDSLIQNQVDTFTIRLVQNIFQKPDRSEVPLMKISDMFGGNWNTFSDFFEGVRNYKKLQFSQAEKFLKNSIELPVSKYYLSDIYYFNGKREEAIGLIREILPRLDGVIEPFYTRIMALKSRLDFNFEEEIQHLERLKNTFPFLIDTIFELGEAHFHRGNADAAIPYYQQAIDMNRNYSKAINHLGYCYSYQGDHHRAIQLFEDYRNLDQSANSFDSLGDGYFYAGDLFNAETMKLAAVSKNRESVPWSCLTLSDIYIQRAEYEKAKSMLEKYVQLTDTKKEKARVLAKKAYICLLERQYKNGLDLLNQSLKTFHSDDINDYTVSEAHWLRGMVLLSLNRLNESDQELAWLDRIRKKFNLSLENFYIPFKYFLHLQALVFERKGELAEAESVFKLLLQLKTRLSYWVTYYHYQFFHTEYIRFLKRSQRYQEALGQAEDCLEFNPSYVPCLWEKAGLMEALGKTEEAREIYQKIAEIYGESAEKNLVRKNLGDKVAF